MCRTFSFWSVSAALLVLSTIGSAAHASVPAFCEVLLDPSIGTVTATTNTENSCERIVDDEIESFDCPPRATLDFTVEFNEPPNERLLVLKCTAINPQTPNLSVGDSERAETCVPSAPDGCLVNIWHTEHTVSGITVTGDVGVADCGWQQTGEEHLSNRTFFVEDTNGFLPGNQPGSLTASQYCEGLTADPSSLRAPWGRRECCRELYDVFFAVTASQDSETVIVRTRLPLAVEGSTDWQYVDASIGCGDGIRQCGEQCDPGQEIFQSASFSRDGCTDTCLLRRCGQPFSTGVSERPTATDALFVLEAAVGLRTCDGCACHAFESPRDSGQINVTDALTVLRASIDDSVLLACNDEEETLSCDGPDNWNPHIRNWWSQGLNREGVCDIEVGYANDPTVDGDPCVAVTACATCGDYNGAPTPEMCGF